MGPRFTAARPTGNLKQPLARPTLIERFDYSELAPKQGRFDLPLHGRDWTTKFNLAS